MHHIQSEARGPARLSSLLISLRGAFFSAVPLLESLIQTFLLSLVFYFKSSPTGLLNSCVTPFLSFVNSAASLVPLKCNSYLILPLIKSFELSLHFLVNSSTTSFKKFKTLYNLIPNPPFQTYFSIAPLHVPDTSSHPTELSTLHWNVLCFPISHHFVSNLCLWNLTHFSKSTSIATSSESHLNPPNLSPITFCPPAGPFTSILLSCL